jgi:hypothetical protein
MPQFLRVKESLGTGTAKNRSPDPYKTNEQVVLLCRICNLLIISLQKNAIIPTVQTTFSSVKSMRAFRLFI